MLYRSTAGMDAVVRPLLPDSLSNCATAQHYGMATRLLDWTSNAAIAIHFACEVAEEERRPQRAAVYWIDLRKAAALGLKIILPPPLAQRVYRQRGVFTHMRADAVEKLCAVVGKISFPSRKQPPFVRMEREGTRQIELLVPDPWLEDLSARSLAVDASVPLMIFYLMTVPHPVLREFDGGLGLGPLTDYGPMIDFIDRLTARWNGTEKVDDLTVLDKIARDNPRIFSWMIEVNVDANWIGGELATILRRLQRSLRKITDEAND